VRVHCVCLEPRIPEVDAACRDPVLGEQVDLANQTLHAPIRRRGAQEDAARFLAGDWLWQSERSHGGNHPPLLSPHLPSWTPPSSWKREPRLPFDLTHTGYPRSVCSLPPCGGGWGRGVAVDARDAATTTTPTPNPSPQGGGEHTELVAAVCT